MSAESISPSRAALYVRVSTEEQREGQTIDSQVNELERFAESRNWAVVGVYKDEGRSGAMLVRPELDRLRDDAKHRSFDVVLVNDVDRLARDVAHLSVIRRDLERRGIRVVFRKLPGELSPTHNLMVNILGSFAEFEREMILDRTRRGIRYKVEIRKLFLGCNAAYGYRYISKLKSPDGVGRLQVHAEEAAVVKQMYDWVDEESLSARQVLARLNSLGIPTRTGVKWGASTVLRILRNETYAGFWHYNKHYSCEPVIRHNEGSDSMSFRASCRKRPRSEWIAVPLPPEFQLVAREKWQRVQEKITKNSLWCSRNSKHNYLLRSLVRCGNCSARMVGGPHHTAFYYRCKKRCKGLEEVREEVLNEAVWGAVCSAIKKPALVIDQVRKYYDTRNRKEESLRAERQQSERALAQVTLEESRILEAYRQGAIQPEQLAQELEKLRTRRKALQNTPQPRGTATSRICTDDLGHNVQDYCRSIAHVLDNMTLERKQNLLRLLVVEIVFYGESVLIRARIPCQSKADYVPPAGEQAAVSQVSNHGGLAGIATTSPTDWELNNFYEPFRNSRQYQCVFELTTPVQRFARKPVVVISEPRTTYGSTKARAA